MVDIGSGGTVTNWGTILTSGTGSAGVEFGFGGTLVNGQANGSAGQITASGIGVIAYGGRTTRADRFKEKIQSSTQRITLSRSRI